MSFEFRNVEKENSLNVMRSEVESWTDGQDLGIENGIKETIVIFNASGYPTDQSCEGHKAEEERGRPYPWVTFNMENDSSFEQERKKLSEISDRVKEATNKKFEEIYGDEGVWTEEVFEKWEIAYMERLESDDDYQIYLDLTDKIHVANLELKKKVDDLLREFYDEKEQISKIRYRTNIFDRTATIELVPENIPDFESNSDSNAFLLQTREEMNRFTEFLKEKYFNT